MPLSSCTTSSLEACSHLRSDGPPRGWPGELESLEVASGWIFGHESPVASPRSTAGFRSALEATILQALAPGPCYVSFSGGRDSSVILAVATDLARRFGLAPPIPVTAVFPGVPGADEHDWQRLVLDHLGLAEWQRITVEPDDLDLIGPLALRQLERRGLAWPAAAYAREPTFAAASGGVLVSGDGGDELFGRRRSYDVMTTLRRRGRVPARTVPSTLWTLAPRSARSARARRMSTRSGEYPWLTEHGRTVVIDAMAREQTTEPLRWDRSTWWYMTRRAATVMKVAFDVISADHQVRLLHPFTDPPVVGAISDEIGPFGRWGRTEMMHHFFGDLLPPVVLGRESKAFFNGAFFGAATREFARSWDGRGVPLDLVDPEVLRSEWLSEMPSARTALLLHSACLATR
jgi:Asparagine synthase